MGAVCLASVRGARRNLTPGDLTRRRFEIQASLVLTSAILVVYVLVSKMLLDWPLSLLVDAQRSTPARSFTRADCSAMQSAAYLGARHEIGAQQCAVAPRERDREY